MFPNYYSMPFYYQAPSSLMTRSGGGLLARLGLRNINWSNLLNSTSRTLGVINQAIPIVKQAGPMFNNMKSMLKIASVFNDVTDSRNNNVNSNITSNKKEEKKTTNSNDNINSYNYNNSPNFFI